MGRLVLLSLLGLALWQGCGRNGLDEAFTVEPSGGAGTGSPTGTAGSTGGPAGSTGGLAGSTGRAGSTGTAGSTGRAGSTGTAGSTGSGSGGSGGDPLACVPGRSVACSCGGGAQGAQICGPNGTFGVCDCTSTAFQRLHDAMVGTWEGPETTPFTPVFQVRLVFDGTDHYSGHCNQASCPAPVFYYGTDDDSGEKTFRLHDLRADGTGTGLIWIFFNPGNVTTGSLEAVTVSPDGQRLRFEFWATWNGMIGPFTFDLRRVP